MNQKLALFFIAAATLMLELSLTRVFDVILTPNMAYMVIACALFSFGFAGVTVTLQPARFANPARWLPMLAVVFAASTVALRPALNLLPFDYEAVSAHPMLQLLAFSGMYVALVVPFFVAGLMLTLLFSAGARAIQALYFWDLMGAAVGCVLIIPLLEPIGPGGILFVTAACGLVAAALLDSRPAWRYGAVAGAAVLVAIPALRSPVYFEFVEHLAKRGVKEARLAGTIEFSRWDPISKIDVIDQIAADPTTGRADAAARRKHIAYDGGTQSSHIFPFDGNYAGLRSAVEQGQTPIRLHFWHRAVLASHRAKRDSQQRVLVIGSAGGQETKAALMYGAAHVDAVEMVKSVVRLMTGPYAEYSGGIFTDPRVQVYPMEGRAFLRGTASTYDIIQIHSNHTSSSVAAGTGAMSPNYLQTAEAYRDYFSHLTPNGILHINHFGFSRMVTTAALAWKQMGRTDFQRHVVVLGMDTPRDTLPTLLVKMQPWTKAEVDDLWSFYAKTDEDEFGFTMLQDPTNPQASFLPPEFFSGSTSPELLATSGVRVRASVDDRPFFNFLRKRAAPLAANQATFVDTATATMLNSQLRGDRIPMDLIHLIVTGIVSLCFAVVFTVVPLYRAERRQTPPAARYLSMVYFSCLGMGFILIELVFIQIFMKLIGYPVYTYALVLFTLLLGAGIGSTASQSLGVSPAARWSWPFVGIVCYGVAFTFAYPAIFNRFLSSPDAVRMMVAAAMMFPLGFFLGMPFPLGILVAERHPAGAVAWAWGLNGLFTVIGSLGSVLLGLAIGFQATILVALAIYVAAFLAFAGLRRSTVDTIGTPVLATKAPRHEEKKVVSLVSSRLRGAFTSLTLVAYLTIAGPARAQTVVTDDPPGWAIVPSVQAIALYEDNVILGAGPANGTFFRVTPGLETRYRGPLGFFSAAYSLDREKHSQNLKGLDDLARQVGLMRFEAKATERTSLTGAANYITTVRPEEVLDDVNLIASIRRVTRFAGNLGVARTLTPKWRMNVTYAPTLDDFGEATPVRPGARTFLNTLQTTVTVQKTERTSLGIEHNIKNVVGEERTFLAVTRGVFWSNSLLGRWSRTLSPHVTATVAAGPRLSQVVPPIIEPAQTTPTAWEWQPEVAATLAYRKNDQRLSVSVGRTQSLGFGASGFVNTDSVEARGAWVVARRLRLTVRPGAYRNTLAGERANSYRFDTYASYSLTDWMNIDGLVSYKYQDRALALADFVVSSILRERTRNRVAVGFTGTKLVFERRKSPMLQTQRMMPRTKNRTAATATMPCGSNGSGITALSLYREPYLFG
jgi:spermidine synthase